MTIDNKDGAAFLAYVTDKLETRIAHISQSILEGQKDIEGMHEYYWENYTEMDQYGYENFDNQQRLFTSSSRATSIACCFFPLKNNSSTGWP